MEVIPLASVKFSDRAALVCGNKSMRFVNVGSSPKYHVYKLHQAVYVHVEMLLLKWTALVTDNPKDIKIAG